jgi:hypothetical protein
MAIDYHRQTGRTTRAIAECVEQARAGERIVYIAANGSHLDYVMGLLRTLAPEATVKDRSRAVFASGGYIRLDSGNTDRLTDRARGTGEGMVFDHAYWQHHR